MSSLILGQSACCPLIGQPVSWAPLDSRCPLPCQPFIEGGGSLLVTAALLTHRRGDAHPRLGVTTPGITSGPAKLASVRTCRSVGPRYWPKALAQGIRQRHLAQGIWPKAFGPRHLAQDIWPKTFRPRHLAGTAAPANPVGFATRRAKRTRRTRPPVIGPGSPRGRRSLFEVVPEFCARFF